MPSQVTLDEALARIAHAAQTADGVRRVFLPFGPSEPLVFRAAWQAASNLAENLCFTGVPLPGINRFDYTALTPSTQMELFLRTPDFAAALTSGKARLFPLHYSAAYERFAAQSYSAIVAHVAPPDAQGLCSLGLAADFTPAALAAPGLKIALINHHMPSPTGAPKVPLDAFDLATAAPEHLAQAVGVDAPASADAIAHHVLALVPDGATIQIGIGRLPTAILPALSTRRGLRLHGGLIAPAHLALRDAGALADDAIVATAGVALGDAAFYRRIATEANVRFADVRHTHGLTTLSTIPRFIAINAALEIDLFGQINAEYAGGAAIASVGGLLDFIRGAKASPGGRAIIMVQAEGKDGVSRIVPELTTPTVSVARADTPVIVTEFGAVDLAALDEAARARALINLAPPQARADLSAAAVKLGLRRP
jgi:acyl-CoA hydrolase